MRTRRIFRKLFSVFESTIKIKVRLHWTLFLILITSAVICKQRLLYGNGIVQCLQNCKCYSVDQDHFETLFWRPTRFVKRKLLLTFKNCHNFPITLTKLATFFFFKSTAKCLKTVVNAYNFPVKSNGSLKFWTNLPFHGPFSCKIRKFKYWF